MGLLANILGGGVGDLVKTVVGTFKLSPEAKLEFEREAAAHAHELAKLDREYETRLLDVQAKEAEIAGANIRAEAASDSWLSKNARPQFIYIGSIVIWANYLVPMISQLFGRYVSPIPIPDEVFILYGFGFGGYVGMRGWEKITKLKR